MKPILTDRFENKGGDMAGFLPNPLKVEGMAYVERREKVFGQEFKNQSPARMQASSIEAGKPLKVQA